LYPRLVVLPPDPEKYRFVNRKLTALLSAYTPYLSVESIDEMALSLAGTPTLEYAMRAQSDSGDGRVVAAMKTIAVEMKQRVKTDIGEWMIVSIGIASNRYLAKVASGLHKPDGLDVLTSSSIEPVLSSLKLSDLCGIKDGSIRRLSTVGITTPLAMYHADARVLVQAFHSILGQQWWFRLHGWEDGSRYTNFSSSSGDTLPKSFGHSFALPKPKLPEEKEFLQIVSQLVMKMGRRLRQANCTSRGAGIMCLFSDGTHWHERKKGERELFHDTDFRQLFFSSLLRAPRKPVRLVAVDCYDIVHNLYEQAALFEDGVKKERLTRATDAIADRWGEFTVTPGRLLDLERKVLDRIAFG
jgi:DNA polymerase-4